jgi:16S rRNA A1518/A1519 N6-dimethyltransferase RsmA/KsgA/DIM1 with predicted DNA glycosylase/AP lyase activity
MLSRVTRALFAARRKTIRNNAVAAFGPQVLAALERAGIDPSLRAEALEPGAILGLARAMAAAGPEAGLRPGAGP